MAVYELLCYTTLMQTPFLIGNWKMKLSVAESLILADDLMAGLPAVLPVTVVVCPSFVAIPQIAWATKNSPLTLGAQDVAIADIGALTGEVSAGQLAEVGCKYVIVGHSERRRLFGETDALVRAKVERVLDHGMTPIVCIGETAEERAANKTEEVLRRQLQIVLHNLDLGDKHFIVAYEPVWAISPNPPAEAKDVLPFLALIKEAIAAEVGEAVASEQCAVIYGGSVSAQDVAEYVGPEKYNGALVGSESLVAKHFLHILEVITKTYAV